MYIAIFRNSHKMKAAAESLLTVINILLISTHTYIYILKRVYSTIRAPT